MPTGRTSGRGALERPRCAEQPPQMRKFARGRAAWRAGRSTRNAATSSADAVVSSIASSPRIRPRTESKWLVHPDPDRTSIGREERQIRAGEVRHLLTGDGQRQAPAAVTEKVVRPGVRGQHDPAGQTDGAVCGGDLVLVTSRPEHGHGRVIPQPGAVADGEGAMHGIGAIRIGDPGFSGALFEARDAKGNLVGVFSVRRAQAGWQLDGYPVPVADEPCSS